MGEIFISLSSRTNIIQNGYTGFIVLPEVSDQTATTANNIQSHQFRIVFIAAECGENIRYIPFRNGSDTVQIRLADVRCSIAKHLLSTAFLAAIIHWFTPNFSVQQRLSTAFLLLI